jgi:2-oxo-4-hydroxy-4-carboxy-5-ureidoimidazoline decarboxylase
MKLADLNTASVAKATEVLTACCGSSEWVSRMVKSRPYKSRDMLLDTAEKTWWSLGREAWLEAFAHHPRIGEKASAEPQNAQGKKWSLSEQSAVARAPEQIRLAQQDMNAQYERRFGYIYIVSATGKTPNEMFAIARDRLSHDPDTELKVAAEEQRKIMRLRLEKLLDSEDA